jgi:quercetin dioxygenase-like cupin family protein
MKTMIWTGALCAAALSVAALAHDKNEKAAAKPAKQAVTLSPADIKWGPAPAVLPKGGEIAVLHGDPFKKGAFALRLKMPDGYRVAPHWHTLDEELTVISGTFVLGMGDKEGDAHALEAGSYHYLPGKAHHYAAAKGDTVVQVNGMGPFDIHYLNAADDPSKAAAASK